MIEGIRIKKVKVNEDERGNFREIIRCDENMMDDVKQVSVGKTKPGIIKAFHCHKNQDDLFHVLRGNLLVVLYDGREDSKTNGETQTIFLGESYEPQIVFIPRGVFHGYKVLGEKSAEVLYLMNTVYNHENPDELRIDFKDPSINFNWDKYGN